MTAYRAGFLLGSIALIIAFLSCVNGKDGAIRFSRSDKADFVIVDDDYALVLLHAEFMAELFGEGWEADELFYGFNRAVDQEGVPGHVSVSLIPLAKGRPHLVFSGTEWTDLICPVYSLTTREEAILLINLQDGTVSVEQSRRPRSGTPTLRPDGRIQFAEEAG